MALGPKLVIVTRATMLDELVARFGTRDRARFYIEHSGGTFEPYQAAHAAYESARKALRQAIPQGTRVQWVDRMFLPTFVFGPGEIVVVLGQDGLVVNTARYLDGQLVVAVNPDPERIDGVLLPFTPASAALGLRAALAETARWDELTMAEVRLNDGQRLLALNDLFIGPKSHGSARYRISHGGRVETQSSSGIIVSTGAGSTGWFRSILAGAAGIAEGFGRVKGLNSLLEKYQFSWSERKLAFSVREPFVSRTSAGSLVFGWIDADRPLSLESLMPRQGTIFADGMEDDSLDFNSGSIAHVGLADRVLRLARPG